MSGIEGLLAFVGMGFWMLMIFDCVRNDPDKNTWLWILIFLNIPGAVLYFVVRRLPLLDLPIPNYFKRWTLRDKLWNAESAAKNIGKSHQFVELGNVLREMGQTDKAADAYQQALAKEPTHPHALWGAAAIDIENQNFERAKGYLEILLNREPEYKFGEASLAYGQTLFELQDWDAARSHLEKDIKHWSHPESSIWLATILAKQGEVEAARDCLETMLFKVKGSPKFHYRRKLHLVRKAESLLRTLRH